MSDSGDPDTARDHGGVDYADELDEFEDELDGLGDADEEAAVAEPDQDDEDDEDDAEDYDESEYDESENDQDDAEIDEDYVDGEYEDYEDDSGVARPYRPGRGGFDPEAAALTARAKYGFRQRVVVFMLLLAVVSALAGGFLTPLAWWGHAIVDLTLIGYLTYLRRQVRIEEEIRNRRAARLGNTRRVHVQTQQRRPRAEETVEEIQRPSAATYNRPIPATRLRPGTVVVEADDEDPMFDELDEPGVLPYRRAVGE